MPEKYFKYRYFYKFILKGVIIGLFFIIIGVFTGCQKTQKTAKGYNLLVITLDTMRADRIGIYGHQSAQTPVLDSLAQKGVMFKNCYSPVPLTLPAHCTIFTGQYPLTHHVRGNGTYQLPEKANTLAEVMKQNGYQTFAVIASYVLLSRFGLNQGFDIYDDSLNAYQMINDFETEIQAPIVYSKFKQWFENNYHQPFFAWVHFYDPHAPYNPPLKFQKKFTKESEGRYDAEVSFVDEFAGKIINTLKDNNILDKTIIVVVGDHGEAFGEHQEHGHGIFCYEESLKVPLIFYNEVLFSEPYCINSPVVLTDLMPTILDIYGYDIPTKTQGVSLVPLMRGGKKPPKRSIYFESLHGKDDRNWAPLMGIIDQSFKYISLPESELYHLENDSKEKENLFWKENRLAKELDKKLRGWVNDNSTPGEEARRELTSEDKIRLKTLGYISSFSKDSSPYMDPKKGIFLENESKKITKIINNGELEAAEKKIGKLIQQFSENSPLIVILRHHLFAKKGEMERVFTILEKAMEKYPKNERFIISYAIEKEKIGQLEEAENTCLKLLKIAPLHTRAKILLAEIEEKRGNLFSAIEKYQQALEIEPQNISLKLKVAELLVINKKFTQALQLFDECVQRREVQINVDLLFKIALYHTQYGSIEKSEQLLKKIIELKPNGKFYFSYALVLMKNRKKADAITQLKIALGKYSHELTEQQIQLAQKAIDLWEKAHHTNTP